MGGASPTFKYCDVAHVSARTRPSPSLFFANISYVRRPGDEAKLRQRHQYKEFIVKMKLHGHTKTRIVKAGQTMNNCHVNEVP